MGSVRTRVNTVTSTATAATAPNAMAPARPGSARTAASQSGAAGGAVRQPPRQQRRDVVLGLPRFVAGIGTLRVSTETAMQPLGR